MRSYIKVAPTLGEGVHKIIVYIRQAHVLRRKGHVIIAYIRQAPVCGGG